jgi:hypothetical protein
MRRCALLRTPLCRAAIAAGLLLGCLAGPTGASAATASPEGLWQGVILYAPGVTEIDVVVELAQAPDGGWVGTIDLPTLGLQFRSLEDISVDGRDVTFWFNRDSPTAGRVESPFRGELSEDGATMTGEFVEGGVNHHRFELERIGDAGDERPAPVTSDLHPLSAEPEELRDAFNRHEDAVRVVMLLSPT